MLADSSESHLVSYLGWVDHGAVWWCETSTDRAMRVRLGEADRLTVYAGSRDVFAVVHHFDVNRLEISAHRISSPAGAVSRIRVAGPRATFDGDVTIWADLPHAYLDSAGEPLLVLIDADRQSVESQRLDWFDDSYDRMYQAVTDVTEVPGTHLLIFTVQRSSSLVLYDPKARTCVRKIALAGRAGNPAVRFRRTAPEVWASDYDTLLRLDATTWSIRDSARLQGVTFGGRDLVSRAFIGGFSFNREESLCAVARPFKGDVVGLDTQGFEVTHRAALGRQPLDVALLSDRRVFARDWKTGDLLRGTLKPRILRM